MTVDILLVRDSYTDHREGRYIEALREGVAVVIGTVTAGRERFRTSVCLSTAVFLDPVVPHLQR